MFGQSVLVLQGGGALGAYQLGVYDAMHEQGFEPDWVVGTSIGAINGAIIAGNRPEDRLKRLNLFWERMEIDRHNPIFSALLAMGGAWGQQVTNAGTVVRGIPGFFEPNPLANLGQDAKLGIELAAYYSTKPLRETLTELVDFDYLATGPVRLTVGAVNANTGEMRYFDSAKERLSVEHILASGALPPAFPAVRIDGEPYWDGGIYSNTPVEVVLDDNPRRDSTIIAVQLWSAADQEPQSLREISERTKDIQFSTRDESHIARQQQNHKLRHIIREIAMRLPEPLRKDAHMRKLCAWGCGTTMHLMRLHAPRLDGEDGSKDIDFSRMGIEARARAGREDAHRMIEEAAWTDPVDPSDGVVIHDI
jgi:NTE family protein